MFTQSRITLLSELALKSYHEAIRPDPFAAIAAHTLAVDAAAFYNPASADAAGFVAISSMINLSGYSAHLASLATEMHEMMKHYHAKTESRHLESKTVVPAFNALIHSLESVTFDRDVRAIYHSTFSTHASDDAQLALSAACKTFPHALATTRSAYTYAVAMASRVPIGKHRDTLFKSAITQRLTADLLYQPISPHFLMRIFCSPLIKYLAVFLLLAGMTALSMGIGGLLIPSVGVFLLSNTGLSCAGVTTIGGIATVSALGLFGGRNLVKNQWAQGNDRSRQAVEDMNSDQKDRTPTPT